MAEGKAHKFPKKKADISYTFPSITLCNRYYKHCYLLSLYSTKLQCLQ